MSPTKKILSSLFAVGLLTAFFPWLFSYQGFIFGQKISLRAMGDLLGFLLLVFGVMILFSEKYRKRIVWFGDQLDALPSSAQNKLMFASIGIYLIGVISHKLRAQYSIGTHAFDLGFFSNICWNTANGSWFYSSILEQNFMAVHVNWILWPLSFIYRIFPSAMVLLVAQAVFMTAAAPILWKLTQQLTGRFSLGALTTLLFFSSPYFDHTISNDFHPDVWLLPCLMAALWAWRNAQKSWLIFFCFLSLLAKEDVSVVVCGFGLMLMLNKGWRVTGALVFAMSLGIFVYHTQVFIPKFVQGSATSQLFSRYPLLGDNFQEMFHSLFLNPLQLAKALAFEPSKYWRYFCYFLPMGGLTFFAPALAIPSVISVMPHILSQASTQLSLAEIYSLPSQPFLFVGGILGAQNLIKRVGTAKLPFLVGALFVVAGIGIHNGPRYFRSQSNERIRAFSRVRPMIPRDSSVAAQQNLLPHFDTRRTIGLFPLGNSMPPLQLRGLENPDFIVADRIGNALPYNGDQLREAIKTLEENAAYEKIFEEENFLLFKRRQVEPPVWKVF